MKKSVVQVEVVEMSFSLFPYTLICGLLFKRETQGFPIHSFWNIHGWHTWVYTTGTQKFAHFAPNHVFFWNGHPIFISLRMGTQNDPWLLSVNLSNPRGPCVCPITTVSLLISSWTPFPDLHFYVPGDPGSSYPILGVIPCHGVGVGLVHLCVMGFIMMETKQEFYLLEERGMFNFWIDFLWSLTECCKSKR